MQCGSALRLQKLWRGVGATLSKGEKHQQDDLRTAVCQEYGLLLTNYLLYHLYPKPPFKDDQFDHSLVCTTHNLHTLAVDKWLHTVKILVTVKYRLVVCHLLHIWQRLMLNPKSQLNQYFVQA